MKWITTLFKQEVKRREEQMKTQPLRGGTLLWNEGLEESGFYQT